MYNRYRRRRHLSTATGVDSRAYRINRINTLSSQPMYYPSYISEILAPSSAYTSDIKRFMEILYYTNTLIATLPEFINGVSRNLEALLDSKIQTKKVYSQWYSSPHNTDYPNLVFSASKWLDVLAKKNIISKFLNYYMNFNSAGKKRMASIATDFVDANDPIAINILKVFLRNIKPEDVKKLLEKIPNGVNNQDVQKIFEKTRMMEYLTFNESAFNNDPKERERIVKAIGRTPSLIKKLDFDIKLSLDDIKKIAPAMRFNFIQHIFKYETIYAGWGYHGWTLSNQISWQKKRTREQHLIMPDISPEEMKELLFSVCLKKNNEFSKWMDSYIKYKNSLLKDEKCCRK